MWVVIVNDVVHLRNGIKMRKGLRVTGNREADEPCPVCTGTNFTAKALTTTERNLLLLSSRLKS